MSFDLIGSMQREANGSRRNKKRGRMNDVGMLPVDQNALGNIFGGLKHEGKSYGGNKSSYMDNDIYLGGFDANPLSEFGETCVDCNNDIEKKQHKRGFETHDLGGAFNGRFKNIGSGFIESVGSGTGSIDYDKGARRGEAVSPVFKVKEEAVPAVFRSGESFGVSRGKLEKSAEREARGIRRDRLKREKEEKRESKKAKKEGREERRETRFENLKRRYEEKRAKRNAVEKTKFTSTKVALGHGAGSGEFETSSSEEGQ